MKSSGANPFRARDLGIPFDGTPGPLNAITDVSGVEVGFTTLIEGEGPLQVGNGPVRTGVTAVLPRGKRFDPVFAGWYSLNGNGEMTGTHWIEESGFLEGPVILTNTASVGVARDAVIAWQMENQLYREISPGTFWLLPVVAETYDGHLNDIHGFHIRQEHVFAALDGARPGPVAEGNVGGGTGMICHEFKGGTGTASRQLSTGQGGYTFGVLVQANHGLREDLRIDGVRIGERCTDIPSSYESNTPGEREAGSIIAVVATDAPLLPQQLKRIARRVPLAIARLGSNGEHYSGDIFIAFSTANPGIFQRSGTADVQMVSNDLMSPMFAATVQAAEEAVVNALVAAETLTGIDGNTGYALPHDRLRSIFGR
jgi:D-aminopeptidase